LAIPSIVPFESSPFLTSIVCANCGALAARLFEKCAAANHLALYSVKNIKNFYLKQGVEDFTSDGMYVAIS
jgi:hypothetical protein